MFAFVCATPCNVIRPETSSNRSSTSARLEPKLLSIVHRQPTRRQGHSRLTKASYHGLTWSAATGCILHLAPKQTSRVQPQRSPSPEALFTGIVQGRAAIKSLEKKPDDFLTMTVQFPAGSLSDVAIGASVALNGTCLTVTESEGDVCSFDLIKETLRATNLGDLEVGSEVNFERSARMGDEIGGHNVSGHVDCKATISKVEDSESNRRIVFEVPEKWMKYILPKGFIGVDGCSLTIGEVEKNTFSVYLIPETLRVTIFENKSEGDTVNIEVDRQTQAIVDTVERYLSEKNII